MDLSPDWVVGFVDGEGCFFVSIQENPSLKTGYQVLPEFRIVQHERDVQVLYALKRFFGCGVVRRNHGDRWELRVRKLSCLLKIVEFFEKHPLKTKKNVDFKRFARILRWMEEGKHLTREGLMEIAQTAMKMNTADRPRLKALLKKLETSQSSDEDIVHP